MQIPAAQPWEPSRLGRVTVNVPWCIGSGVAPQAHSHSEERTPSGDGQFRRGGRALFRQTLENPGGPGILATDACDGAGLEVPELSQATQAALRKVVEPNGAVINPVDLVAGATPMAYEEALHIVLDDKGVDAGEVASAYCDMAARRVGRHDRASVQPMARPGVETIVGVVHDRLFGPLVMFGLGGVATELQVLQRVACLAAVVHEPAELDHQSGDRVRDRHRGRRRIRVAPALWEPDVRLRRMSG